MRSFILHTLEKTRSFDINNASVLAAEPKGLGNNFATSYKESQSGKHLTNVIPDFEPIQLQIYFNADGSNGYANYKYLAEFLAECGISPFLFEYRDGINVKFTTVINKSLPKSDIDENGVFSETFIFERQDYWYEDIAQSFSLNKTSSEGNAFPMGFPFGFYGVIFQNSYRIKNTFFKPAPIEIKITGAIESNIKIYIDNAITLERVAELQLSINCPEGRIIQIIPSPAKQILVTENDITLSRYDITDKTKQSFLFLPFGEYIIGANNTEDDTGAIVMSIKRYLFD